MAKPGRNDRCPCGSGKKYKQCCLAKDEAGLRAFKDTLASLVQVDGPMEGDDPLMDQSNAVVDLVHAGRLEEAEAAARALLARYPDVHDGWDRLGFVHEKRGENHQAAECYRKVVDFLRENSGYADAEVAEHYAKLVAKLDPPATT